MMDVPQSGILVIDDDKGPRESLRILLKKQYRVFCAENVRQGLDVLRKQDPDLIIMDIRMPEIDGIEGLRMIREIDAEIPVIMLTGYGSLETAQEALRLGANDYLKKPFETDELLRLIPSQIEQGRIARGRLEKERELRELNKRLIDEINQRNHLASLGQASAELVHDLRNPMTVVYGYVQLLSENLRETLNDPATPSLEVFEYLEMVEKSIARCTELINVWQSLGKKDPQNVMAIDVSDMLAQVVGDMQKAAYERRAKIENLGSKDSCHVLGDRVQLVRVFQNLIGNAIEALNTDGAGRVRIDCSEIDGYVRITVEDNGCGIPADVQQQMMQAFVTTKRKHKGSGLGLFISRKIIDDHHGKLEFAIEVGVGSRFTVELPSWTEIAKSS